jgi:hypothetical protein
MGGANVRLGGKQDTGGVEGRGDRNRIHNTIGDYSNPSDTPEPTQQWVQLRIDEKGDSGNIDNATQPA